MMYWCGGKGFIIYSPCYQIVLMFGIEKYKTCMENKVENLIVEWLKSGDENATNLAHKICVLFNVSNTEVELCDKCCDTGGF